MQQLNFALELLRRSGSFRRKVKKPISVTDDDLVRFIIQCAQELSMTFSRQIKKSPRGHFLYPAGLEGDLKGAPVERPGFL